MLVGTRSSQITNTLRLIEWASFRAFGHHLFLRLARTAWAWGHGHGHSRHLRETHALKSHHGRHRIVLIKRRKCRRHARKPTRSRSRELARSSRRSTPISSHPVAPTTPAPAARRLECAILGDLVLAILVHLESFMEVALAIEVGRRVLGLRHTGHGRPIWTSRGAGSGPLGKVRLLR